MSEWKEYIFENLIKSTQLGTSLIGNEKNPGIPLLKMGNLDIGGFNFSKLEYLEECPNAVIKSFIVKYGDFLFNTRNTLELVGKSAVWKNQLPLVAFNSNIMRIKFHNFVNDFYLGYYFSYEMGWKEFKKISTGTTSVAAIYTKDLFKCNVVLPPLPHQRKIARILTTVDNIIETTEVAIAKYKAIKQGMMHDLFSRGIDVKTGKLRPVFEDVPQLYKESELGMIPKEWEVKPLEKLTTQIGDGIHATPQYTTNTHFYFINGNNLVDGKIVISDSTLCVDKNEYKKHFIELANHTILYSINGTIGNVALFNGEKVILGKSAAYISCAKNFNWQYIYFALQTKPIIKFYENEMTSSTIKNLSLASIRKTPIPLPIKKNEQNKIADRINAFSLKLQKEECFLAKYKKLKQGLMQDLLTGKKEVIPDPEDFDSEQLTINS